MFYIACASTAVSSIVFGLSVNLYMAIGSRVLLGLLNPTVGLIKTVVSELCAPKDQAFAMSVVSASWSIGLVIGPSIGGWTSRPAVQYPGTWIADIELFGQFPYLLPNLITAVCSCLSMLLIYLYLPETLGALIMSPREYEMVSSRSDDERVDIEDVDTNQLLTEGRRDSTVASEVDVSEDDGNTVFPDALEKTDPRTDTMFNSVVELLRIEPVRISIMAYFALSYIAIVYDEIGMFFLGCLFS